MEDYSRLKINSRDQPSLGTSETVTTRARQSLTLHDRFKPEKPTVLYADLHHRITKNIKDTSPKVSGNFFPKQHRKGIEEEELVKYMSHLPSYLERGENRQEKVLNVGVLDWSRLEKWQCSQKQIPQRSGRHSLSSGNSSSSLSTEGSSVNSSSDQSCSPARQTMRRPSLQCHLTSSAMEVHSQDVKVHKNNAINEGGKFIRTDQLASKIRPEIKLDQYKRKDLEPKVNPETGTFNGVNFEVLQHMKVKENIQDGEFMKGADKLQEQKSKRVVPGDLTQGNHSKISQPTTMLYQKGVEVSRRSFSEMPKDISPAAVSPGIPHSCPLPFETEGCTETKWCSTDAKGTSLFPDSSCSVLHPAKQRISPTRCRISEIKKSITMPMNSTLREPSAGLDLKLSKAATEKPRSTSPFRRLSIGMGKISKSFSSKEGPSVPQLSTIQNSVKPASQNAIASSCHGTSSSDAQNATSRARSSPLRRLLDPLLKPKAPNCHHSGEPLHRDPVSTDKACRPSSGRVDSTGASRPGVVRLDMGSCRAINIDDTSQDKKHGSSSFQALLRVAVKNGQPLFTFAVNNERNILAATMKLLSSPREDDYNCIYTFFAIQEIRKKNGRWMNQSGKGKDHDYIPNFVAQLKVSGSQLSHWTRETYMEQSFTREFVLFAVDLQQAEHQPLDFEPNDELAAIVVRVPKVINRSTASNGHLTGKYNDLLETRFNSTSGEQPTIRSQSLIDATIILPSGIHSLPNKGGPSSLIQRWRSGGACDCGGWDLGCKLRIFANQSQLNKKSSSAKACSITDKFELISLGGDEENQPVFGLSPFKDGIYSVEFTSSLTILQAFSMCIAVLDSKKICEVSESGNLFEGKTSLETILAQNDGTRAPNGIDGEVSARYVSYPPHSPVGRV